MTENVEVAVPGGTVYLVPTLPNPMAVGILAAINEAPATVAAQTTAIATVVLQRAPYGAIVGWTFTEDGLDGLPQPVEVTEDNIARLLSWTTGGKEVAEKCSELYTADLYAPFVPGLKKSLRRGPMDHLTSATPKSGSPRPKRSKPSSPNGTAGMSSVVPAR